MKKRQGTERESPSKVLLVCVYDTVVVEVSNEAVFARFSPFGPIIKILIFEKGEVTKFFLEYLLVEDAARARECLDGARLYESICKMNIYFSNFASVDLKHETTEGVSLDTIAYPPAPTPYYYPQDYYYTYPQYHADGFSSLAEGFQGLALEGQAQPLSFYYPVPEGGFQYEAAPEAAENLEETIESNIDWLLKSEQKKSRPQLEERPKSPSLQDSRSSFLSFPLSGGEVSNRQVYNLFSNFGNVSYVKKTKKTVFIKFRSVQFAAMAKNYLHGFTFLENDLQLTYVSNPAEAEPREDEYSEITYFDSSFDRFTAHKSITINPPGSTLHVSSLRRESCRCDNLKYLFEEFGTVEAVEVLGNGSERNMALVKFRNIEDCFYAMAEMHNRAVLGRKLQLSFTKSKLI